MRGTGATLRSGRVRVFARRIVVPVGWGGRFVGTGTSTGANVGCGANLAAITFLRKKKTDLYTQNGVLVSGDNKER
jgi:hypothetical protein